MTALASLVTPTPVGDALLIASNDGLVTLELVATGALVGGGAAGVHTLLLPSGDRVWPVETAGTAGPNDELAGATALLRDAARQLDDYFAGALRAFTVPLDWRLVHRFAADALRTIINIPYGETAAYGEVAILAGRPGAARAVGTACARSPWSIIVPVHRVVRADGSIGPYGNHPETKRFLINLEQENTR